MTRPANSPTPDESADLPEGWVETTVGRVAERIEYGYTASAKKNGSGPRLLRITDIQGGQVNWDTVPSCDIPPEKIERYRLAPGDILFARTGATTGKSFLVKSCPDAVFASYLIRVTPSTAVDADFLSLFFHTPTYWRLISDNVSGNAQPNCNASKLASLPLPLPPLPEQRRLVAQVEALLARVNVARERLAKVPEILKRFRQSVLAAACSGRLTEDWREQHPSRPITTDVDDPPSELPPSWSWMLFRDLIHELRNGVSPKPRTDPPGIPILRISAVRPGHVLLDDMRYLEVTADTLETYRLRDGDLLFTRYNGSLELLGICGLVRGIGSTKVLYPDKLMRVRVRNEVITPDFAEIYFQSPSTRERITAKAKSSAGQQGYRARI